MTSSRLVDIVLTISFCILSILAVIMVNEFPFRDKLFPYVASAMIFLFAIVSCASIYADLRSSKNAAQNQPENRPSEGRLGDGIAGVHQDIRIVLRLFGFILLLVLLVLLIGHLIAIPLFIFVYMKMQNEPLWIAVISAGGFFVFTWTILVETMNVAFPIPYLVDWLGL